MRTFMPDMSYNIRLRRRKSYGSTKTKRDRGRKKKSELYPTSRSCNTRHGARSQLPRLCEELRLQFRHLTTSGVKHRSMSSLLCYFELHPELYPATM
ncbi:hypothetical protein ACFX11_014798 [Malus domestica]